MLPFNCLDATVYPLSADLYYGLAYQDDFGKITRTWYLDRTIKCSAISDQIDEGAALTPDIMMKFKDNIKLRTPEDIRVASDSAKYPLTEILITNIRNSDGIVIWKEYGEDFANIPTVFEVQSTVPSLDPFQNVDHYYVYLGRSQNQDANMGGVDES
jgi:hypothetical protein